MQNLHYIAECRNWGQIISPTRVPAWVLWWCRRIQFCSPLTLAFLLKGTNEGVSPVPATTRNMNHARWLMKPISTRVTTRVWTCFTRAVKWNLSLKYAVIDFIWTVVELRVTFLVHCKHLKHPIPWTILVNVNTNNVICLCALTWTKSTQSGEGGWRVEDCCRQTINWNVPQFCTPAATKYGNIIHHLLIWTFPESTEQ